VKRTIQADISPLSKAESGFNVSETSSVKGYPG